MPALTREEILNADDLIRERLDIPEWDGYVFIRALTAGERDAFEAHILHVKTQMNGRKSSMDVQFNRIDVRAKLASLAVVDDDGNRVFSEKEIQALSAKSGAVLDRIYEAAQRLSGMGDKDIDELEGNSEGVQT